MHKKESLLAIQVFISSQINICIAFEGDDAVDDAVWRFAHKQLFIINYICVGQQSTCNFVLENFVNWIFCCLYSRNNRLNWTLSTSWSLSTITCCCTISESSTNEGFSRHFKNAKSQSSWSNFSVAIRLFIDFQAHVQLISYIFKMNNSCKVSESEKSQFIISSRRCRPRQKNWIIY